MAKRGAGKSGLENLSVGALQAEIRRRERQVGKIMKKRARLLAQLHEIDAVIAKMGVSAGRGGVRTRAKNEVSLVDALLKVLNGKTMNVTELTQKVQDQGGYRTTSANFRTIVNQTLINSGKFKRVGRGEYAAKA